MWKKSEWENARRERAVIGEGKTKEKTVRNKNVNIIQIFYILK